MAISETRRILLDGTIVEVRREGDRLVAQDGCRYLNYEGEVAIVIGCRALNIRRAEAESYIAGHTLGVVGPGLVRGWMPADRVLRTYVNGRVVQQSSLSGMIWNMACLVTDLARMMTLLPGDLIMTGTPANSRPVQPEDVVAVEVEGLGRLENTIVEGQSDISNEAGWPSAASERVLGVALGEQLRE